MAKITELPRRGFPKQGVWYKLHRPTAKRITFVKFDRSSQKEVRLEKATPGYAAAGSRNKWNVARVENSQAVDRGHSPAFNTKRSALVQANKMMKSRWD